MMGGAVTAAVAVAVALGSTEATGDAVAAGADPKGGSGAGGFTYGRSGGTIGG
jgi:hypothetical protein